jgi:hypothetical protein
MLTVLGRAAACTLIAETIGITTPAPIEPALLTKDCEEDALLTGAPAITATAFVVFELLVAGCPDGAVLTAFLLTSAILPLLLELTTLFPCEALSLLRVPLLLLLLVFAFLGVWTDLGASVDLLAAKEAWSSQNICISQTDPSASCSNIRYVHFDALFWTHQGCAAI